MDLLLLLIGVTIAGSVGMLALVLYQRMGLRRQGVTSRRGPAQTAP